MTVRNSVIALFLGVSLAAGANAATDEERAAQALLNASSVVLELQHQSAPEVLAEKDGMIEKVWRDLIQYYGPTHELAPKLSLLRARAATARHDKRRSIEAWKTTMGFLSTQSQPNELLPLYLEAAAAVAAAGDSETAGQYYAAARAYSFVRGDGANVSRLQIRAQELKTIGGDMSWRELRDSLADLREFSEGFPMWTVPRLEALVAEAEIRLDFEPDDKEKREALSKLKADIVLMQKGMNGAAPPGYKERVRTLFYALEDRFKL
ncbi:MAG: hypothetical protein EP335_04760 [Alphaproteobacteria bacterium]|nr:MAG: hypothetical protein EP335_04760 [Alphaproteobacteria bacterium]